MLKGIYNFILSRGVSKEMNLEDKLTSSLNLIASLTSLGAFGIFLTTFFFSNDYVYRVITFGVSIAYLLLVVLHHFCLIKVAKLYLTSIIPFWYVSTTICIGGYFSQSISAAATIGMTFILFKEEQRLRNSIVIYNIFLYVIVTLYITFNPPIFGVRDFPFDEIVVFILSIGWIYVVFYYYELDTQNYIKVLKKKNIELNQKTIELEHFSFIASHDLKSPLQNIIGFLNLIDKNIKSNNNENLHQFVDYAKTQAHQMDEIIKGVLEITVVNQESQTNNGMDIDLNICLDKALYNLKGEIEKSNSIIKRETLPVYHCNQNHFVLIFQNLIQNAIKYNKSTPPIIFFRSKLEDENFIFEIEDNGIGIEDKYFSQVFQFFKRLHTKKEYPGSGLGLGLVKKLVEIYDGQISLKSSKGKFSIFRIELPQKI